MLKHAVTMIALVAGAFASAPAPAQTPTPKQVVEHHIKALQKADVDQLTADYAPNAVFVLSTGTYSGLDEIRKMFIDYFKQDTTKSWLAWDAVAEPRSNGVVIERWSFYRGTPKASSGTDVIVVRDGKIVFHTMGPDAACPKGK